MRSPLSPALLLALCVMLAPPTTAAARQGGQGRGGGDLPPYCGERAPAEQESDEVVYGMRQVSCRAKITARAEPRMPPGAREKGVRGAVVLRVALLASGRVGKIAVVEGMPEGITEEAVKAARQIEFRPAAKDGRRVSQYLTIQYNFSNY